MRNPKFIEKFLGFTNVFLVRWKINEQLSDENTKSIYFDGSFTERKLMIVIESTISNTCCVFWKKELTNKFFALRVLNETLNELNDFVCDFIKNQLEQGENGKNSCSSVIY